MKTRPAAYWPAVASLLALAATAFLGKSYETGLRGIDSNIHASVSMGVTSGPDWRPRLPIPIKNFQAAASAEAPTGTPQGGVDANRTFNDHPFFVFWLNGLVMRALGPEAWSARLLTGLFSIGSVTLTLALGSLLVSRVFGMLAALLLVFCRDFILTSATVSLDTALVFFILLTFWLWLTQRWKWLALAAGVGLWVKTPLVLLVFPVALAHHAIRRELRSVLVPLVGAGVVAVLVGSLVWVYTGAVGGWDLARDYWVRQLWGTAVGGRGDQAQGWDWGRFFLYNVRTGFLPGLPFLLLGVAQVARRRLWREPSVQIPLIATGIVALVVTAMRFKLGHYFTPIFPFLSLLSAHSAAHWLQKRETGFYQGLAVVTPVFLAFLLINPVSFGPEGFVALRRFVPFIQTHGSCDDVVAIVPGGEPVGSDLDGSLFLSFYTGRTTRSVACETLATVVARSRPAWIFVSDENLKRCLPDRAGYPTDLLVGTQHLLGRAPRTQTTIDLTPLELDHRAVTDCRAPVYPRDSWHRYIESK